MRVTNGDYHHGFGGLGPSNDLDTFGHGRPPGSYPGSGNPAANYTYNHATRNCYSCHSQGATHAPSASATDPYRLGVYATNTLALCDVCHGPTGTATKIDMQEHTRTITGSTKTRPQNYNFKCVDCHDPHGDTNFQMVRSHFSAPTTGADASFASNSYGTPQDTVNATAVTFTSTAGRAAGSYSIAGGNGICEDSHNETQYFRRGDAVTETHNSAQQCTVCHKHTEGFKCGACFSCHGDNTARYCPDSAGNSRLTANYGDFDNDGEHTAHVSAMSLKLYNETLAQLVTNTGNGTSDAKQQSICGYCHVVGDGDHTALGTNQAESTGIKNRMEIITIFRYSPERFLTGKRSIRSSSTTSS